MCFMFDMRIDIGRKVVRKQDKPSPSFERPHIAKYVQFSICTFTHGILVETLPQVPQKIRPHIEKYVQFCTKMKDNFWKYYFNLSCRLNWVKWLMGIKMGPALLLNDPTCLQMNKDAYFLTYMKTIVILLLLTLI